MPKALLGMLAALSLAAPALARQDLFPEGQVVASSLSNPEEAAAADLDGDGDLDLVAVNRQSVTWFPNLDGQGTFGVGRPVGEHSIWHTCVIAADVDGDGDPDVLAGTQPAGSIPSDVAWLENLDGLGTFGPRRVISTDVQHVVAVVAADVDGDGDLDVLSASESDDKLAWYENTDGAGSFGPQLMISLSADAPSSLFAADLDGDGDTDALSTSTLDDKVAWHENADGLGTFGAEHVLPASSLNPRDAVAADLDSDGDRDVLLASEGDNTFVWYQNLGAGTFGLSFVLSTQLYQPSSVSTPDLDGDGDLDVLCTSFGLPHFDNPSRMSWFQNADGVGTFFGPFPISDDVPGASSCFAADLDADGDLDPVCAAVGAETYTSFLPPSLTWYEATSVPGVFGAQQVVAPKVHGARDVSGIDVDSDADADMVVALSGDDEIVWYENTGDGVFALGPKLLTELVKSPTSLAKSDLDADGDLDLLSASSGDSKIAWYENSGGPGGFGAQQVIDSGTSQPNTVTTADLDGDGDADALAAFEGPSDLLAWYENTDGLAAFGPRRDVGPALYDPHGAAGGDLDGDGDLDVLSALWVNDKVLWYENLDGLGNFGAPLTITTSISNGTAVLAGDRDSDGDLDVFWCSLFDDKVATQRNLDGSGSFGPVEILHAGDDASRVAFTDLDGDGDDDLVAGLYTRAVFFENTDGLGAYAAAQTLASTAAIGMDLCDVGGHGGLDLLAAGGDTVAWRENAFCSTLASAEVVRVGSPPNPLALLPGVTSPPVVGATWDPVVDHSTFFPSAAFDVLAVSATAFNVPTPIGTLLCAPPSPGLTFVRPAGVPFAVGVPWSCGLVGAQVSSQAVSLDAAFALALTNALDITIGTF